MATLVNDGDFASPERDVEAHDEKAEISIASLSVGRLWQQAVAEVDLKPVKHLHLDTSDTLGLLNGIYQEAQDRMAQKESSRKTWRLRGGREFTFREIWGKVLGWVQKFQTIGDIAIQADAGYASLPWVRHGVEMFSLRNVTDFARRWFV